MKQRKQWIDCLRGLCMAAILLNHTEMYYAGTNLINYNLYVTDALCIFFFISGYLIFKERCDVSLRHKLASVLRTLVMPYFIFTTLMALPKAMAHGNAMDLLTLAKGVVMGQASWFVAALAVAELVFVGFLRLLKANLWAMAVVCGATFGMSMVMEAVGHGYFWQTDCALQVMPLLLLGYVYHKYETRLTPNSLAIALPAIALVGIKCYVAVGDVPLVMRYIDHANWLTFLVNAMVSPLFMCALFKRLPAGRMRLLCWTGRHTIVYYFICGGVPLMVGKLFCRLWGDYNGNYAFMVAAFCVVYAVATGITYLVYRFVPCITDARGGRV